jgi:hypothetical protein
MKSARKGGRCERRSNGYQILRDPTKTRLPHSGNGYMKTHVMTLLPPSSKWAESPYLGSLDVLADIIFGSGRREGSRSVPVPALTKIKRPIRSWLKLYKGSKDGKISWKLVIHIPYSIFSLYSVHLVPVPYVPKSLVANTPSICVLNLLYTVQCRSRTLSLPPYSMRPCS